MTQNPVCEHQEEQKGQTTNERSVQCVEEVHVHISVPPEDNPPCAIEDLIITYCPPAGFGAADQPNGPPSAADLRLYVVVDGPGVPQTDGPRHAAGHLAGRKEPFQLDASTYQHVPRVRIDRVGAGSFAENWVLIDIDISDAAGVEVASITPRGPCLRMRIVSSEGPRAAVTVPKDHSKAVIMLH